MTAEQAYFFTVALINLVLAFSGARIKDPEGKQKSILFFTIAFTANFLSWFLYVFEIGIVLKIVSAILSSVFIWGLVIFSYKRCEYSLPLTLVTAMFVINSLALGYFTYVANFNGALHVSALFVPLAFCIIGYLFINVKKHRNPSDIVLAYACFFMAAGLAARSALLELSPELFSATIISSQVIWPVFSVISGVFALLSFTEEAQFKLKEESNTDQLTGLANRRNMDFTLNKEWARAIRHARPLALVMLDVDFFKKYNDHLGHQAGDECLKTVAKTLLQKIHRPGDLVARYGGEEFLLILPDTDGFTAQHLAEEICASVAGLAIPHKHSPVGIITISAGSAVLAKNNHTDIGGLLRAADSALYEAKQNGRNQSQLAI
ncbi:diguanylate cyclase [Amphritea japonica]|uniref:diguanylate cyclase n=1 Tax=Amphritea japonica ATCC BAA-1530 TaxID=1278309 RepID=A0A7R6SS04_9GAMM|nr:diguanylate cyclase [Amphritea japonica]BBB25690.1 signal transduction protein [Amphritea japonica ATCC BAA-1530]